MSSFNVIGDQWDFFVPGDSQKSFEYGYVTHHGLLFSHSKYNHTKLGYTFVMNIWNVDAQQRQTYHKWCNYIIWCQFWRPCQLKNYLNYTVGLCNKYVCISSFVFGQDYFYRISSQTTKQNLCFLWHLVDEISHFEFDAYCVILTGATDLTLFVGGGWHSHFFLPICTQYMSHRVYWILF